MKFYEDDYKKNLQHVNIKRLQFMSKYKPFRKSTTSRYVMSFSILRIAGYSDKLMRDRIQTEVRIIDDTKRTNKIIINNSDG